MILVDVIQVCVSQIYSSNLRMREPAKRDNGIKLKIDALTTVDIATRRTLGYHLPNANWLRAKNKKTKKIEEEQNLISQFQ